MVTLTCLLTPLGYFCPPFIFVFKAKMCLLYAGDTWTLFLALLSQLMSFVWGIQAMAFKVN